ncbi:MAG: type II secretion system inner membrane protein GspF [Gammaproteobacteria bacterium]|nr:type II secretion system inner membrane protein GspF [Gammaproteobacteria bacterium]MCP4088755.1 type II secretion system inner membrane protein GspF [Gammaproteobacteria bacterium]MCP4275946.1 type II secretion system inner membrane protein GspF [Gammaproteobacteria bacterium]MCP4832162.1 type II secretion system inner membrane protein GspF [Gammaproteobacteria bacterium]MCP4928237.1 type II secretion system inner membrane protein GspF [Gammaproteobacteria bacterium]
MGAFEYTAVDPDGKQHHGVLEGDTARQVRQQLRDRDLLPITVIESAQKESTRQSSFSLGSGLSASDLAVLTRQLATLVQSSMPLEEALAAVGEQNENARMKTIVLGVRARVREGFSFADGLKDFPRAFPDIYRATVGAGEQSGHLDAVLERLADYTESRQELVQKIRNAMIYPIVLLTFCLLIVTLMMTYVVPKVVGVFVNTGEELPGPTAALIILSDFLQSYGWLVLVLIGIGVFAFRQVLKKSGPRKQFDAFMLRIPITGRILRGLNTARFMRTFSIMTGSGVPVLEGLKISAEVITSTPMREAVEEATLRIREGAPIGTSLGKAKQFPPLCIHLISSGEASGQLEAMLSKAAGQQEREMDGLIGTLLNILEPGMIIFMGILVLSIVIALLLPIFEMNKLVL